MAKAILVPQVGQDLTEAKIVDLLVKLGDKVAKGDLVAVVESEKASFDVEAFAEGIVISLPYAVGDVAPVLEPLMLLGEAGEVVTASAPAVVADAAPADAAPAPAPVAAAIPIAAASKSGPVNPHRRASPVARRQAAARGVDVADIAGSGPGGAVVLADVMALGHGSLSIRTLQSGQGVPVVFLHGWGADLSSWRPMVAAMGAGLPMMALDLPGHGASRDHGVAGFADIVAAVRDSLRSIPGGVHLVGHSLGAAVAVALTEAGGPDVRSLTLIAPAGLGPSVNGDFLRGFLAARTEAALAAWMRLLVSDPASLAPVLVRATMAARDDAGLVAAQERVARAVFEGSTQLFSVVGALRRFDGPCTVIAGRDDAIVSFRDIEAAVPGHAALHRLDRVGHLPQVEAAALVQTLVARTLRSAG